MPRSANVTSMRRCAEAAGGASWRSPCLTYFAICSIDNVAHVLACHERLVPVHRPLERVVERQARRPAEALARLARVELEVAAPRADAGRGRAPSAARRPRPTTRFTTPPTGARRRSSGPKFHACANSAVAQQRARPARDSRRAARAHAARAAPPSDCGCAAAPSPRRRASMSGIRRSSRPVAAADHVAGARRRDARPSARRRTSADTQR